MAEDGVKRSGQIMKLDASALLNSLKDLEQRLNDHNRQDKLPVWSEPLLARLNALEASKTAALNDTVARGASMVSMADVALEDRLIARLRLEMDAISSSTRLSFESKMTSTILELDRLHKLLEIRPTTSEMQLVVLSVHDLERKTDDSFEDLKDDIRGIIQEKLSDEMKTILLQLKSSDSQYEEKIGLVSKKVDGCFKDLSSLKVGVENTLSVFNSKIEEQRNILDKSVQAVSDFKTKYEQEYAQTLQRFAEINLRQDNAQESFDSYREAISKQFEELNSSIELQNCAFEENFERVNEKISDTNNALDEHKDEFVQACINYDNQIAEINNVAASANTNISKLQEFSADLGKYIDSLKEVNLLPKFLEHEENIGKIFCDLESHTEKISEITDKTKELTVGMADTNNTISEMSAIITEQRQMIDTLIEENDRRQDSIRSLEACLRNCEDEIFKLSKRCDEIIPVKVMAEKSQQQLASNQETLSNLTETTDEVERKIENIHEAMEASDEAMSQRVNEIKMSLLDSVQEKQAEMAASIANMRENLEIISGAGDDPLYGGGGGGIGGVGMGKGGARGRGAAGGIASMIGGAAVAASAEEQRAVALSQANSLAELCINYEEIAVRKTYVPEIPPMMCEQITATTQALTAFIATCIDAEMVQRMLRDDPNEVEYDENLVSEKRQSKLDEFISEVSGIVTNANPQPNITRFDARDKFLKQVQKALQMCMSKHDQVLVIGNSRLGRLKIPTCIACDRPLVGKVSRDTLNGGDMSMGDQPNYGYNSSAGPAVSESNHQRRNRQASKQRESIKLPSTRLEEKSISTGSDTGQTAYILRGGFKMPRSNNNASTASLPEMFPLNNR